jgi:hypothetical protein
MKRLLLLVLSSVLVVGCAKPNTVIVPVTTPHPTITTEGFNHIESMTFSASNNNGMICLTQEDFINLTTHLRHSRISHNKLLDHVIEFNKNVEEVNARISSD